MIIPVVIIYYISSSIDEPEQHKTNTHLAMISLLVVSCVLQYSFVFLPKFFRIDV